MYGTLMAPDSDGCIFLQDVFSLKTPKRVWRAPTLIGNGLGESIEFPSEKKGGKLSDHLSIWKIQTVHQMTSCCPRLLNWKPPRLEANLDSERQDCLLH